MLAPYLRYLIPLATGIVLYHLPVDFVSQKAWQLFSIFSATILGIICRPYPMGAVAILGLTIAVFLGVLDIKHQALVGFASPTIWLVGSVFFISRGFINSRLGERIAYHFIYVVGKTPLRLAYTLAFSEFMFAPAIPSSTARAGGIMTPIIKAIALSFGSDPKKNTQQKIGAFLMQVGFHSNIISSAIFLTGMVSNPLAQSLARTQGVIFNWLDWFSIAIVPGLISLLIMPLILYKLIPPTQKDAPEAHVLAEEKLKEIGKFSDKEKKMSCILASMLFLWIFGDKLWDINSTGTALLGLSLCIATGVITIQDVLSETKAWETILWLAILVTMSMHLEQFGFIDFVSSRISTLANGMPLMAACLVLLSIYFWIGYIFAGNSAHVSALYTAFLGVLIAIGAPPVLSAVVLGALSSLYSSLTPYGSTSGSVFYSMKYVDTKTWWRLGFIIGLANFLIWILCGGVWWRFLGYF